MCGWQRFAAAKKGNRGLQRNYGRNFEANMQKELHGVHTDGQGDIA